MTSLFSRVSRMMTNSLASILLGKPPRRKTGICVAVIKINLPKKIVRTAIICQG